MRLDHTKIVVYSDIHWHDYQNGISLSDISNVESEIAKYVMNTKVSMVLFLGDMFESRNPSMPVLNMAHEHLKQLNDVCVAHKTKCVRLLGNHDRNTNSINSTISSNFIKTFHSSLSNTYLLDRADEYTIDADDNGEYINILSIPAGFNIEDTINEQSKFNKKIKQTHRFRICVFHDVVRGAKFTNGTTAQDGTNVSVLDRSDFDMVLGGDIHKYQDLDLGNTHGMYVGAPIQHGWGDSGDKRGFFIIDLHKSRSGIDREVLFVESKSPKFIKCKCDIQSENDMSSILSDNVEKWNNNIIKLTLCGPSRLFDNINTKRWEDIISDKIKTKKIKINVEYNDINLIVQNFVPNNDKAEEWKSFLDIKKDDIPTNIDTNRLYNLGLEFINDHANNNKC